MACNSIDALHSKAKGNIGEAAAALSLMRQGFSVFKELGDLSRIDLLAVKADRVLKIQVKASVQKNGIVPLSLRKSGPNYSFTYQKGDVDYFAVVDLNTLKVAFVPETVLDTHRTQFALRVKPTQSGQVEGTRSFDEFLNLPE